MAMELLGKAAGWEGDLGAARGSARTRELRKDPAHWAWGGDFAPDEGDGAAAWGGRRASGAGEETGDCGKRQGSPAVGAAARGLGRAEKPPNCPGDRGRSRGTPRLGQPWCLISAMYLFTCGHPPGAGGVREEALRLRGAGRRPGLLCAPRHCPPCACAAPAPAPQPAEHGARQGWRDGADGAREPACGSLAEGTRPHPRPHPPPQPPGRGAYGWRTEGCLAGQLGGTATAPTRQGAAGRVKSTCPNAPWTHCPTRPPCG